MKPVVSYKDLIRLGFKGHQARDIIHQTKINLMEQGLPLYNGRRIGVIPVRAIERITGFPSLKGGSNSVGRD